MEAEIRKKDAPKKEHVKHCAPEVTCRPALMDEIPRPSKRIEALAQTHGWETSITYARGTTPSETSPKLVHSIALRLHRPGQRAVAVWSAPVDKGMWTLQFCGRLGNWKCGATGKNGVYPIKLSADELKAYIRTPAPVSNDVLSSDVWGLGESIDVESVMGTFAQVA